MSDSKRRIDFIDQIRGIAILTVFLVHCLTVSFIYSGQDDLSWVGWVRDFNAPKALLILFPINVISGGVPIFFAVSGFCIHLSFLRNPNWRNFAIRRFFRIYPPYFFAVLLFAIILPFPWSNVPWGQGLMAQLGSHLALVHNYNENFIFGINAAFWSIAVEAQLYIVYPILLALVSRLGWHRTLLYMAVLEISIRAVVGILFALDTNKYLASPVTLISSPLTFSPLVFWYSWSIGALVADAYFFGRTIPFTNHSLIVWGVAIISSKLFKPLTSFSFLFFSIFTVTAIAKLLQHENHVQSSSSSLRSSSSLNLNLSRFLSRMLRILGIWSYSIYLLHFPLLFLAPQLASKLFFPYHSYPLLIFFSSLCLGFFIVGISALWYYAFELPSVNFGKNLIWGRVQNRVVKK